MAALKKGPGLFVYRGGIFDTQSTPTVLRQARNVPVFDAADMPVLDAAGRQVYEAAGAVVRGLDGKPVLGGPPKMERSELASVNIWGIVFPKDQPVQVDDKALALKLRGKEGFRELDAEAIRIEVMPDDDPADADVAPATVVDKPRRGRPPKPKQAGSAAAD